MTSHEVIKEDLSELTFADKLFIKEKLGTKKFNETVYNIKTICESKPSRRSSLPYKSKVTNKTKDDDDDESPVGMPLGFPINRIKKIGKFVGESDQVPVKRDPRFDDLSGTYNEGYFRQAYGFLSDVKQREKQKLIKSLKVTKDAEKRKKIQGLLMSMKQQEESLRLKEEKRRKMKEIQKKEREQIKQGKSPFYLKKSLLKKMEKEEKVNKMKNSGTYDKYLLRKEKKKLAKERKKLSLN